jgi:ankyrin repeat protein
MRSSRVHFRSIGVLCLVLALSAASRTDSPLADAARRGDVDVVRSLLRGGSDVNASEGDGMTALHWAAETGRTEIAEILIYAGANLEAVTRLGDYTPMHLAGRNGAVDVLRVLLGAGADANAVTTSGGSTVLHFAAGSGSAGAVRMLLEGGAHVDAREASRGQTPLMFAAASGRAEAIRELLRGGADPSLTSDVVDLPQRYAQDRAAGQRRDQVLAEFRAEAGPGTESWRPSPSEVEAAVLAARQTPNAGRDHTAGRDEALNALRQEISPQQAEQEPEESPQQAPATQVAPLSFVDIVGTLGGTSALLYAVREGHDASVLALLEGGASIDQPSAGDRTSPLAIAVINGHFDLALWLLERGADPNLVSEGGTGPLFAALNTPWAPKARYPQQQAYRQQEATYLDVARALLEAGADPNRRLEKHVWFMEYTFTHLGINMTGATPFWRATHALDVEAMKLLVAYGADPNIPTVNAPSRRRRGGGGADPSGLPPAEIGGAGVYPIHAAAGHGYGTGYAGNSHRHVPDAWLSTLKYLVGELGADVDARDSNGYTPLHNAASRGDTEMIEYLASQGADVMVISRRGQTTVDMANGPQQRTQPYPEAIELLESLGARNSHRCLSCQ